VKCSGSLFISRRIFGIASLSVFRACKAQQSPQSTSADPSERTPFILSPSESLFWRTIGSAHVLASVAKHTHSQLFLRKWPAYKALHSSTLSDTALNYWYAFTLFCRMTGSARCLFSSGCRGLASSTPMRTRTPTSFLSWGGAARWRQLRGSSTG
jgi:hypothetical protein